VNSKKWTVIREQELTENQIAIEPITIYQLPFTNHQLPVTNHQLPVTIYQSPVTSYQLPFTNHQLPFTAYTIQTKDNDSRDDLKKKI